MTIEPSGGHRRRADTQARHLRAMPAPRPIDDERGEPQPTKDWRHWIRHPGEWRAYRRLLKHMRQAQASIDRRDAVQTSCHCWETRWLDDPRNHRGPNAPPDQHLGWCPVYRRAES